MDFHLFLIVFINFFIMGSKDLEIEQPKITKFLCDLS